LKHGSLTVQRDRQINLQIKLVQMVNVLKHK